MLRHFWFLPVSCVLISSAALAQSQSPRSKARPATQTVTGRKQNPRNAGPATPASKAPNLTKQPTLYVVGYAHLDTEWRWEYPQVIQEYLTKTMRNNFALFEKYPHYIFNFTGANRYRLMKEYYPADFERLKQYVAAGRWIPAGSSMEEGDVNSPNAESILRQILYGNNWFRREFGVASDEYMLPDCFGFPASLPSILAHAGIKGFSTQKLSSVWQPAPHVGGSESPEKTPVGIPFNVGLWEGPDGRTVIAALNPLGYGSQVTYDISKPPPPPPEARLTGQPNQNRGRGQEDWPARIQINGAVSGIFADYHYVGTGDVGGSPNESSVKLMEAITTRNTAVLPSLFQFGQQSTAADGLQVRVGDGPVNVVWSKADQLFKDILGCCATDRLPRYKGDLELINHSAGSLTSQAYQKRWMRKNELLADAAEKASVAAAWLGARPYPLERLNNAWTLVMGGQFHDLLPGTATPKSFEFAWNDDVIAMNQFAGVLTNAVEGIASGLNTEASGSAIIVYNPLNVAREDVVEATVTFPGGPPASVSVTGPDGRTVPAQISNGKVLFLALVPSVGFAVFDVHPGSATQRVTEPSSLKVTEQSLENDRYRLQLDGQGDVSSIFDKQLKRELLSAPIRLAISTDNPRQWPAWNMDFEDEQRPPRAFVGGPAKIRIVERGPVRATIEVEREIEGSKFLQTISLSSGDAGNRVEFNTIIDWHTKRANLKATFPLSAANKLATYNWDVGTMQRSNAEERQFEVASHQWIDLTDANAGYGVTILTDCKNGSDKPDDRTLRLTLVRTPGTRGGFPDQGTQDLGRHEIRYGLAGHATRWQGSDWQAYRLNQPLIAFQSAAHSGPLGKSFSLLQVSTDRARVMALKKAELSDELIVRLVELDGRPVPAVHLTFPASIIAAREVNGQEQPIGPATITAVDLVTSLAPYQLRTFALKLASPHAKLRAPQSQSLVLDYDLPVASRLGRPGDGSFDWSLNSQGSPQGKALPAELLPPAITFHGIRFALAPDGQANALVSQGQTIKLPQGKYNRVYLLAAAMNGDQKGEFRIGDRTTELIIQDWTGFVGQWNNRVWKPTATDPYAEMLAINPGFIKRSEIAWFTSQRRAADGSAEAYAYSYLFAYPLDVPAGARTLVLPENERIRILAISVADEPWVVTPAQPLYDTLDRDER